MFNKASIEIALFCLVLIVCEFFYIQHQKTQMARLESTNQTLLQVNQDIEKAIKELKEQAVLDKAVVVESVATTTKLECEKQSITEKLENDVSKIVAKPRPTNVAPVVDRQTATDISRVVINSMWDTYRLSGQTLSDVATQGVDPKAGNRASPGDR